MPAALGQPVHRLSPKERTVAPLRPVATRPWRTAKVPSDYLLDSGQRPRRADD